MTQSFSYDKNHAENWSSSFGFILGCVGSAIGLGNLWKFPYITYENGGGAFVLVYLSCILVIGVPLLIGEMAIGRHCRLGIYGSFKKISCNSRIARFLAFICILSTVAVLSFYSVVAGWTLEYFIYSFTGNLSALTLDDVGSRFGAFAASPVKQILYHTLFMAITMVLLIKGTKGIERAVKILMPLLGIMVCIIVFLSTYRYGAGESLSFLFNFDFSKLTVHGLLEALGHAFFTLSLGFGAVMIYGSYLPKKINLTKSAFLIAFFDTLVALLACMMMYPIILGTDMELQESASMLFTTLTVQFHSLPGGQFVSSLFYLLIAFAALSSTISLLEIVVSFISEECNIKRFKASLVGASVCWGLGIFSALSNGANMTLTDLRIMDRVDYVASNWGLPIGAAIISIFAGWFLSKKVQEREFGYNGDALRLKGLRLCLRYTCPLLIIIVMLFKLEVLG